MSAGRRPLRVAYLADQYPRVTETFVYREVSALRAQGFQVETLSLWPPAPSERVDGDESRRTFYLRPARRLQYLRAHSALLATSPRRYLRALLLALRTARPGFEGTVDQLRRFAEAALLARRMSTGGLRHLHNHATDASCTVAMLAAPLGGFSFSLTVHGPGVFFAAAARRLDEKLRRATFVRCISYFCRGQCLIWTAPERWDRLRVVHCGVDPQAYAMREHRGAGSHLLFVGRLVVMKGLPILIHALARLGAGRPGLRLTIVGDGPERAAIEAQARSAGVEGLVLFAGYQSEAQVAEWLRQADVFVLPSFAEGVPVALMEAMAAGVPVVATDVGGVSELVENGVTGFLVPASALDPLIRRIETLLDDPGLRHRMGLAGREAIVRDFDLHRESARLGGLFEAALDGRAGAPGPADEGREVLCE
jgi:glycosyltransferase involved in cell wall biosynthesis